MVQSQCHPNSRCHRAGIAGTVFRSPRICCGKNDQRILEGVINANAEIAFVLELRANHWCNATHRPGCNGQTDVSRFHELNTDVFGPQRQYFTCTSSLFCIDGVGHRKTCIGGRVGRSEIVIDGCNAIGLIGTEIRIDVIFKTSRQVLCQPAMSGIVASTLQIQQILFRLDRRRQNQTGLCRQIRTDGAQVQRCVKGTP